MAKGKSFPQRVRELEEQFTAVYERIEQLAADGFGVNGLSITQGEHGWMVAVSLKKELSDGDVTNRSWIRQRPSLVDALTRLQHDVAGTEPPPF